MYPDETTSERRRSSSATPWPTSARWASRRALLTDNGSAFRSKTFAEACRDLHLKHSFTRPYRPQTNGKAERFIQSALREWAYGIPYNHSSNAPRCSNAGFITTTGTALIKALKASHLSLDLASPETTS